MYKPAFSDVPWAAGDGRCGPVPKLHAGVLAPAAACAGDNLQGGADSGRRRRGMSPIGTAPFRESVDTRV